MSVVELVGVTTSQRVKPTVSERFDEQIERLPPRMQAALPGLACSAVLLIIVGIVYRREIFSGWTFPWDFIGTYSAAPGFVAATFGHLHPQSWDPFVASGSPVAVNLQSEVYFPVWWIMGFLGFAGTLGQITDVQILHVFFGGVGLLALSRARGLPWRWALVAGAAYVFFGGFYGETEHADIFRGFAYLPWLLWTITAPAEADRPWRRLFVLPLITWLIASGAYPAQLIAFGICGAVYLALELLRASAVQRRRALLPLALAIGASACACAAVLLPYYLASHAHELYRPSLPTAAVRASTAIKPEDLLGLYLNPFAWRADASFISLAVGTPALIGLALSSRRVLVRHGSLLIAGIVALALAMLPSVGPIGRLMAGPLTGLFPSRFPSADYKSVVAVAIILISADAWRGVADRELSRRHSVSVAAVFAVVLLVLATVAPTGYAYATRTVWLIAVVLAGCVALTVFRPSKTVFVCALFVLIIADGWRDARDSLLYYYQPTWQVPPAEIQLGGDRNSEVRALHQVLYETPATRAARVAPAEPFSTAPGGSTLDSSGWVGAGYHLVDYGGTIEKTLERVEESPTLTQIMLEPWHAYVFACSTVGCRSGHVHLPSAKTWKPSASVKTTSYGIDGITYTVDVSKPSLMVENELAIKGWSSSNHRATIVNAGTPLRAWRLSPGEYQFTAHYSQPGALTQAVLAIVGVLLLASLGIVLWRPQALPPFRRPSRTV